jgi:hypothetical protein
VKQNALMQKVNTLVVALCFPCAPAGTYKVNCMIKLAVGSALQNKVYVLHKQSNGNFVLQRNMSIYKKD